MTMRQDNNTPPPPIPLGPFDLFEVLGRGGMGEVWKGVHRRQKVPVAVKVVSRDAHPQLASRFVASFLREVQTVAALDHPGIVLVLDYGEVPAESQEQSQNAIMAGSPYLAMELAPGGSLRDALRQRMVRWPEIRELLLTLLDALAHAHARGVIHRDLKPDNILWCGDEVGWKLTDFGIAHALHQVRRGMREQSQGTPSYMAPEQIMGRWRDYGPWTDLYALGCLAHQLAAGRLPFEGTTTREVADAHLWSPPPRITPTIAVPAGFEEWISRLLMKEPDERFQFASDAADSLRSLPDPPQRMLSADDLQTVVQGPTPDLLNMGRYPSSSNSQTAVRSNPLQADKDTVVGLTPEAPKDEKTGPGLALSSEVAQGGSSNAPTRVLKRVPIEPTPVAAVTYQLPFEPPLPPESWHQPEREVPRRLQTLVGAGLGLYGLRSIPLVGRQLERDRLWSKLRKVCMERRASCVVLRGTTGLGKSRLARWLCERAHEVGAASVVKAVHSPMTSSYGGVSQMVGRLLRCVGLSRQETHQRLATALQRQRVADSWEWDALTELLLGPDRGQGKQPLLGSPAERYGLVYRLLVRQSRRRALVVWLDDVQWGDMTLDFVQFVLGAQAITPCPLLLVLTVQEESLAETPQTRTQLEAIERHSQVMSMVLQPLVREERQQLVGELLGLEESLASQVAERSGGNPLFAVQLVGDWVERGLLESEPQGFRLIPGARATLPDDLYAIWSERIRRFLHARQSSSQTALELAAVLGQELTDAEWRAVCRWVSAPTSYALVLELVDLRLAHWTESGWAFSHGMLRESLERLADEAGRLPEHHSACADLLLDLHGDRGHGLQLNERLGHHYTRAGKPEEALEPLFWAARRRYKRSDYRQALYLLDAYERAADALEIDEGDLRVCDGRLLRAKIAMHQGQYNAGLRTAQRVERSSRQAGWMDLQARALVTQATIAAALGQFNEALKRYTASVALFEACGDRLGKARCERGRGNTYMRLGDREAAGQAYRQALALFQETDDLEGICRSNQGIAELYQVEGQLDRALELYKETLQSCEELNSRYLTIISLNGIAEIERLMGHLDVAEDRYRRVLALSEAVGSVQAQVARINIALVLIALARYDEAHAILEALMPELEAAGRSGLLGGVHAELLPCVAALDDWESFDRHMNMASTLLSASGAADHDDAWPAQLAGTLAADAGMHLRAERAFLLSRQIWAALGRDDKVDEVDAALEQLDLS